MEDAIQNRKKIELENKLREDRVEIYNNILEPFIIIFTSDYAWNSDPVNNGIDKYQAFHKKVVSVKYRESSFKLTLLANDEVVKANNNLWQYFYQREDDGKPAPLNELKEMMALLGKLLLEIRKSMGNEETTLTNFEMLEWFIKDARK